MHRPAGSRFLQNVLIGSAAVLFVGTHFVRGPGASAATAGSTRSAASASALGGFAPFRATTGLVRATAFGDRGGLAPEVATALGALSAAVRPLSHPQALEDAFRSYFAYRAAHPDRGTKPYLYFVDYGLPSTAPRGYVFDMDALTVVDGPFMVAHGRGSSVARDGVPTRFSNASGSAATSLGLYVAQELYGFLGHAGGREYRAVGMRLMGVSTGFNDNARARRVVAHGAPYVTGSGAGRSEGCPALEPDRAARLLPKLANGGLVFLFAPDREWMAGDPWLADRGQTALAAGAA